MNNYISWYLRLTLLMVLGGFKVIGFDPSTDTEGLLYGFIYISGVLACFHLLHDYNQLFVYQKIINLIEREAMHVSHLRTTSGEIKEKTEIALEEATIAKYKELDALKKSLSR